MRKSWRDSLGSGKIVSFRRAAILAISIVLIRLVILATIKDRDTLLSIDDVIFAIGSTLAAISLLYGASNSVGRSRKAWMVIAISQVAYALGDVSWAVIEAGLHQSPFPSMADFWYLAFYPIFALGIFLLPAEPLSSRERIKFLIDAGIVVVASVFLFWAFMIAPIITSNEAVDLGLAVSAAYPIMDLVVLAALMELIFRKLSFTGSKPPFLLALGLVMGLIADVIFSIQTQAGTYVSSSLPDTLWLIGYMSFGLAGVLQANTKALSQPSALSATYNKSAAWSQYLPYLAVGTASFLLIWGYENTRLISYSVLIGFIAAVIGLAFMRQKVTLDESNQLLATTLSQIQKINLAEEALRKSEQEKTAILEGLKNVSVEYLDSQMHIVWVNSAVQKHLGLSEDEIKGKRCFEVIQGLESPCPGCTALKALQTAQPQEGELVTPDGKVWISHSNVIKNENGDLTGVVHVAVNITERKMAEEALQESENTYRAIFENTGTAMLIVEDNTVISLANSEFERLIGYSREEIERKISWIEFVVKEDQERMLEQHKLRRIDPNAASKSYECRIKDKNGRIKNILLYVDTIPGTKKSVASMLDITDRKQMEEDLRESKERYKILAESSQDMIYVIARDDKVEYVNSSAARGMNRQPEEIIGSLRSSFFPPDVADRQKLRLNKVFDTGLPARTEDVMIVGGREIWQDTHLIPLKADNGIYAVLGISRDITERKRAEEAIRDSESKLASIIDFLPDATLVIDSEKKIIAWNRAIEEMTGVSKDNMIGKGDYVYTIPFYGERRMHLLDLIDLNDKDLASKYQYVKRKGNTLYAETYTPALYGGKGAYVWATGAPLFDNKGNRIGAIESIRDITEFKKAERTLMEQLNFLQQLIDSIPNPIFYKDTKGIYLGCNIAFETITGYSKDKIVGHTVYELYPKELADVYYEADNKLFQDPGVQMYESSMAHTDGSRHAVMFSKATYFDTEGRLAGLVGVILDITERKHMEIALKESERRLADIIDFLPDATLVIDKDGKVIAWNRAMEALTGIKAEDMLEKGDYEYALPFYSQKRPILVDLVLEPESEIEKKYSDLKWIDGTLVGYAFTPNLKGVGAYLWGVASPIYDIQGRIVGAIESIKDITEQKRMEKALQESKDYLDKIINSIGDPLFVKNRKHRMTLVNDAACKLFGRPREEILGKTASDLFPSKEMAEISWMKDEEVFVTGVEVTNEETNTYAPGATFTVLVKKTLYTDNEGNQFLVGITRDITDRKQAEDRIIASLKEKEILLKEVHHRVKNNLQIISALLSLQSSKLTDDNIIKVFRDSQNRIKSMALIHENLYRSEDLGKVDFNEYIRQLVSNLSQSYCDISRNISFKVNSDNVFLNINTAIPCGMIINELVSNSLKYAFPDGRNGAISINLRSEDDGYKLIIGDNGVGIKKDLNIKDSKTLGFRLIDTLVRQIDGKISFDTINGTRCEIHFKGLK